MKKFRRELLDIGHVEARRRAAHLGEVEPLRQRIKRAFRDDRVRGAEARQQAGDRRRFDAVRTHRFDGERTEALRQPLPVRADQERVVREFRHRAAEDRREGLENLDLRGGVGDVVFAAHDMRNLELQIIDAGRQRVEVLTVFADEHGVGDGAGIDFRLATDEIGPFHLLAGELEPPVRLAAFSFQLRAIVRGKLQRRAIIHWRQAAGALQLALAVKLVGGFVAGIEEPRLDQCVARHVVTVETSGLARLIVPLDAEPGEIATDAVFVLFRRALLIGVIDP